MKRFFSCLALTVIAAFAVANFLFLRAAFFGSPQAGALIRVVVPRDDLPSADMAKLLADAGVVSQPFTYRAYAWFDRATGMAKAGTYEIQPGTPYRRLARIFALGPRRSEVQFTVIEGWTLEDIRDTLLREAASSGSRFDALAGTRANQAPMPDDLRNEYEFLKRLPAGRSLEGYLFPDTYRVWDDRLPGALIEKQLQEFERRFGSVAVGEQSRPLTTLDEVVTLASIVEKEVRGEKDRRIVAGIFLRRMEEGMALQSDATLTYLTGTRRARASASELDIDSPFNTYRSRGLPPGPICNPGANAIEAVLNPLFTSYRYFLTDAQGRVLYASTFEEHVRNKQKAGY